MKRIDIQGRLVPALASLALTLTLTLAPGASANSAEDFRAVTRHDQSAVDFDAAARDAVRYRDVADYKESERRIREMAAQGEFDASVLPTTLIGRELKVGPRTNPWSVADYVRREAILAGVEPPSHEEIARRIQEANQDVPGVAQGYYLQGTSLKVPPMGQLIPDAQDGLSDTHEAWQEDLVPPVEIEETPELAEVAEVAPVPRSAGAPAGPFGLPGSTAPDRIIPEAPSLPTRSVLDPARTIVETARGTGEARSLPDHAREIARGTGRAGLQAGQVILEAPVRTVDAAVGAGGEYVNGVAGAGVELGSGAVRSGRALGEGYRETFRGLGEERSLLGHIGHSATTLGGAHVQAARENLGGAVRAGQRFFGGIGSAARTGWNRLLGNSD